TNHRTRSLHDALPISPSLPLDTSDQQDGRGPSRVHPRRRSSPPRIRCTFPQVIVDVLEQQRTAYLKRDRTESARGRPETGPLLRSEEHTSELQSRENL